MTNRNEWVPPILDDETPDAFEPINDEHGQLLMDFYWAEYVEDKNLVRMKNEKINEFIASHRPEFIRWVHRRVKAAQVRH